MIKSFLPAALVGFFHAASVYAVPSEMPKSLETVFYQAAWQEYIDGISQDLEDPSIARMRADDFRSLIYKTLGAGNDSFKYRHFHTTQDDSDCRHTQITTYEGLFTLHEPEEDRIIVDLERVDVFVTTAQAAGCAPGL